MRELDRWVGIVLESLLCRSPKLARAMWSNTKMILHLDNGRPRFLNATGDKHGPAWAILGPYGRESFQMS